MLVLADFEEYLQDMRIPIRLSCETPGEWPVVISLWYIYLDGSIYCATRDNARVISYLKQNDRCGFEIAADFPPYCGLRGQARAILEKQKGSEILEKLIDRYIGRTDNQLAEFLLENKDDETAIRLEPVRLYEWNFSSRMKSIAPDMINLHVKTCP